MDNIACFQPSYARIKLVPEIVQFLYEGDKIFPSDNNVTTTGCKGKIRAHAKRAKPLCFWQIVQIRATTTLRKIGLTAKHIWRQLNNTRDLEMGRLEAGSHPSTPDCEPIEYGRMGAGQQSIWRRRAVAWKTLSCAHLDKLFDCDKQNKDTVLSGQRLLDRSRLIKWAGVELESRRLAEGPRASVRDKLDFKTDYVFPYSQGWARLQMPQHG